MRKNKLIAAIIFGLSFTTSSICFDQYHFMYMLQVHMNIQILIQQQAVL